MSSDEDWAFDCSPLRGLVTDESRFALSEAEASQWYLIRLELLCLDVGKMVLRPGCSLMCERRPLEYDSTVLLSHKRSVAVGSIRSMSNDRRFLEEQLKILEEQVNGRTQPPAAPVAPASTSADHAGGSGATNGRYEDGAVMEGSPEDEGGAFSHSGTDDWDPDTHTSTDSELEGKRRRCLAKQVKREYSSSKKSKPRGPSLRAELTHKRHPAATLRNYSRVSKETPSPLFQFNTLRASDFQSYAPQQQPEPLVITMTFDQQSQTEASCDDTHALRNIVAQLQGEVNRLSQKVTEMQVKMQYMQNAVGVNPELYDMKYDVREEVITSEAPAQRTPAAGAPGGGARQPRSSVLAEMKMNGRMQRQYLPPPPPPRDEHNTSNSFGSEAESEYSADMVAIGSGKTLIPRAIYSQINWHSYTIATRKLLMAVFPRRTLATHSLTGKASPAFSSKPAKLRLDLKKVTDIVMTVADNCGVREGLVRSCITTKCADENKMYRMRLEKKAKKAKKSIDEDSNNQENTPPQGVKKSEIMDKQYAATPLSAPRQA